MRELRILAGADPAAARRAQVRRSWRILGIFWLAALVLWLGVTVLAWHAERSLGNAAVITGYALFAVILSLAFFKARKRLLVLPLGTVREWMLGHVVLGAVSIPLYFQHTRGLWPDGRYEQAIAFAFYAVTLSGIAGYALQRLLPRRLADIEGEVIYERIPSEVAALREEVEELVLKAVKELGSDTLGRYYEESLEWFFWRPRFLVGHVLGSGRSASWIRGRITALRRYLSEDERAYLVRIEELALRKSRLDAHYALQSVLKFWLFIHVPASVLLVLLASWHLLVVNIYAR
ncbi:MAG: hypothetical protein JSS40_06390 [Proteobacteria bacterium]|nr:hypothetical protein [Pseudomonadota bacterium]